MRLEDAKAEVLERISRKLNVKVSENDLTFNQKQALTSIAQIMRQLIIAKQILMIEKTKQSYLTYRIIKSIRKGEEDIEISNYIKQIDEMQEILDEKIEELANSILEEQLRKSMITGSEKPNVAPSVVKVLQPLQCTNCGGSLKIVSPNLAECEYCGMKYSMSRYLSMLRELIEK